MWMKMPLGLGPGGIVLDKDPPPPKKVTAPNVRPLCTEVDLSVGEVVLAQLQLPSPKKGTASNFRPMSVVAKRLDGSRWHLAWR